MIRRLVRAAWARIVGHRHGTIVGVRTHQRFVALTFDDGPEPRTTLRVLDVLERHGAKATFFLIGSAAESHPGMVACLVAGGHCVGHHTYGHVSLPGLGREEARDQVERGAAAAAPYAGPWFRPPYGHLDPLSWRVARDAGHEVVAWSQHVEDWLPHSATVLKERLRAALRPGAILLLHDGPQPADDPENPRAALLEALDSFLAQATRDGWRFVTLPELLACGRVTRRERWRSAASPTDQSAPPEPFQIRHGA